MDDLIVKFCESRKCWLFIVAGTVLLALVFVLPAVDEYGTLCNEKSETSDKLASAKESARLLVGYEKRHDEQIALAQAQRDKTLHEANEAEFRNAIVKIVRENGCQLRRLNVSGATSRNWGQTDDPLETKISAKQKPTGFYLERRQIRLALAGPANRVDGLIESLEKQDKQYHIQALDLKPSTGDGSRVELSLELWCFTLVRKTA